MNGFEALRVIRSELPSGETEVKSQAKKRPTISQKEEECAVDDWRDSFSGKRIINKNGITKFVAYANQPKIQVSVASGIKKVSQTVVAPQKKPIIKTQADDEELLKLMSE